MSLVTWISWKGTRCEWATADDTLAHELALALGCAGLRVDVSELPEPADLTAPVIAGDDWAAEDFQRNAG